MRRAILDKMVKGGFKEVKFEQRGQGEARKYQKRVADRGRGGYRGPKVRMDVTQARISKEASLTRLRQG